MRCPLCVDCDVSRLLARRLDFSTGVVDQYLRASECVSGGRVGTHITLIVPRSEAVRNFLMFGSALDYTREDAGHGSVCRW